MPKQISLQNDYANINSMAKKNCQSIIMAKQIMPKQLCQSILGKRKLCKKKRDPSITRLYKEIKYIV